jgi:Paf1
MRIFSSISIRKKKLEKKKKMSIHPSRLAQVQNPPALTPEQQAQMRAIQEQQKRQYLENLQRQQHQILLQQQGAPLMQPSRMATPAGQSFAQPQPRVIGAMGMTPARHFGAMVPPPQAGFAPNVHQQQNPAFFQQQLLRKGQESVVEKTPTMAELNAQRAAARRKRDAVAADARTRQQYSLTAVPVASQLSSSSSSLSSAGEQASALDAATRKRVQRSSSSSADAGVAKKKARIVVQEKSASNLLKSASEFVGALRFRNRLVAVPFEPKTLDIDLDEVSAAVASDDGALESADFSFTFNVLADPTALVPIDLVDSEPYLPLTALSRNAQREEPDAEDDGLLHADVKDARLGGAGGASKMSSSSSSSSPSLGGRHAFQRPARPRRNVGVDWLRRAEYVGDQLEKNFSRRRADTSARKANDAREVRELADAPADAERAVDNVIDHINESFDLALKTPVHPDDPSLKPVAVMPLMPDFARFLYRYRHVRFEVDPTPSAQLFCEAFPDTEFDPTMTANAVLVFDAPVAADSGRSAQRSAEYYVAKPRRSASTKKRAEPPSLLDGGDADDTQPGDDNNDDDDDEGDVLADIFGDEGNIFGDDGEDNSGGAKDSQPSALSESESQSQQQQLDGGNSQQQQLDDDVVDNARAAKEPDNNDVGERAAHQFGKDRRRQDMVLLRSYTEHVLPTTREFVFFVGPDKVSYVKVDEQVRLKKRAHRARRYRRRRAAIRDWDETENEYRTVELARLEGRFDVDDDDDDLIVNSVDDDDSDEDDFLIT